MPVPNPGSKVWSHIQKFKFLTIFGRPKTGIFGEFRGVPGNSGVCQGHVVTFQLQLRLRYRTVAAIKERQSLVQRTKRQSLIQSLRACRWAKPREMALSQGPAIHVGRVPRSQNYRGETVYPRETPGISSSGPKNKIGGVLGHACADSGPRSWV